MNHQYRAIQNLFQNDHQKFKTIVSETIKDRISVLLEEQYKTVSKSILNFTKPVVSITENTESVPVPPITQEFEIPKGSFTLKDGTSIRIDSNDQDSLLKLYENLNTNGKDRFKKIIFETKSGFDRLLNLAKIESKKHV